MSLDSAAQLNMWPYKGGNKKAEYFLCSLLPMCSLLEKKLLVSTGRRLPNPQ